MRDEGGWRRAYDFFIDHWVLSAFMSTIPAWFFAFVELAGKNFQLLDENGLYKPWVFGLLIAFFFVSSAYNFVMALAARFDKRAKKLGQFLLSILLESVNAIKHEKVRRFVGYIDRYGGEARRDPFFDITQPKDQIDCILTNLQIALSRIAQVGREDISVSVIYKTKENGDWRWLAHLNIESDLELHEIVNNPQSAIGPVIAGKQDLVFYPNKLKAQRQGEYIASRKDVSVNGIGSILCKDISLETEERFIRAILSISTYGLQLCNDGDFEARSKITGIVLPAFVRRLQLELALFYIKDNMSSSVSIIPTSV